MAGLQEYKCPCCGGALAFDSTLQKMKCPYCDTEFEMSVLQSYDQVLSQDGTDSTNWDKPAENQWEEGETDGLRSYVCQSCGGEIIGDASMAATSCPYCGNPVVVTGQFTGSLKPDYVIPFKLDKEAAKAGLRSHMHGKRLLPKVFLSESHIDEVKGIYVPFWLFDADTDVNLRYKGTKVRTWSDSDYNYTETRYYSVQRNGKVAFDHVPVDGSSKMEDTMMESLEPYDFTQAVNFQTAYLAGYLADKYDVTMEQSMDRAADRIRNSAEQEFERTINGYSSLQQENKSIQLYNGRAHYALLPVWLLNTSWNGKKYTFAMNGQTGKFVGDLPMDKAAYLRWLFGLTGGIGAALLLLFYLVWLWLL